MEMRTRPDTRLEQRFSSAEASAVDWALARSVLDRSEVFWLSTVKQDGRPHVTPLIAVWMDGAMHFCTGETEQKARNLERNPACVLTTGDNALDRGLDVVIEGAAVRVTDDLELRDLADTWESKYGSDWHFDVVDGAFAGQGGRALVYRLAPVTAFGFAKGEYGQTRWRFDPEPRR